MFSVKKQQHNPLKCRWGINDSWKFTSVCSSIPCKGYSSHASLFLCITFYPLVIFVAEVIESIIPGNMKVTNLVVLDLSQK